MIATPTGHAAIPLATRHVSPTLDIIDHDTDSRSCSCVPRIDTVPGGYVVVHNRTPLAQELDDRLASLSSRALTYVIRRAKAIQKERLDDGVFE